MRNNNGYSDKILVNLMVWRNNKFDAGVNAFILLYI